MVCKDCEKKLTSVIVPDKDRAKVASAGSAAAAAASSSKPLMGAGGAAKALSLQSNSLIGRKKAVSVAMLASGGKCKICKGNVHQQGAYCQSCAYKVSAAAVLAICTRCLSNAVCSFLISASPVFLLPLPQKGICAMCGKKILDTKFYKQSTV